MTTSRGEDASSDHHELLEYARDARAQGYTPYSGFRVGAAVRTDDGSVYRGVNVENASYGLTICAERSAVFSAITAGHRRLRALAVATGSPEDVNGSVPCEACLQVLSEFMDPDGAIILGSGEIMALRDLLPRPFKIENS
jgi:cytidine deaminase